MKVPCHILCILSDIYPLFRLLNKTSKENKLFDYIAYDAFFRDDSYIDEQLCFMVTNGTTCENNRCYVESNIAKHIYDLGWLIKQREQCRERSMLDEMQKKMELVLQNIISATIRYNLKPVIFTTTIKYIKEYMFKSHLRFTNFVWITVYKTIILNLGQDAVPNDTSMFIMDWLLEEFYYNVYAYTIKNGRCAKFVDDEWVRYNNQSMCYLNFLSNAEKRKEIIDRVSTFNWTSWGYDNFDRGDPMLLLLRSGASFDTFIYFSLHNKKTISFFWKIIHDYIERFPEHTHMKMFSYIGSYTKKEPNIFKNVMDKMVDLSIIIFETCVPKILAKCVEKCRKKRLDPVYISTYEKKMVDFLNTAGMNSGNLIQKFYQVALYTWNIADIQKLLDGIQCIPTNSYTFKLMKINHPADFFLYLFSSITTNLHCQQRWKELCDGFTTKPKYNTFMDVKDEYYTFDDNGCIDRTAEYKILNNGIRKRLRLK